MVLAMLFRMGTILAANCGNEIGYFVTLFTMAGAITFSLQYGQFLERTPKIIFIYSHAFVCPGAMGPMMATRVVMPSSFLSY